MKHSAEYQRFTKLVDQVLSVSHNEMKRSEGEYKKQVDANPRKRGPKPKVRPSASPSLPKAMWGNVGRVMRDRLDRAPWVKHRN